MIQRQIGYKILQLSGKFPVITLTGPRQSGKTTLVQEIFKDYDYVSLEHPESRLMAESDPSGFLNRFKNNLIIDEIQHVPKLLSYIQVIVDKERRMGQFILTGSQSLLLLNKITQSLAGRTAILKLLPFSFEEIKNEKSISLKTYEDCCYTGFFPAIFDRSISPGDFYPAYVETYIQRDIRQIQNIRDLSAFTKFLKLCAGRIGQLIDYSSLANDTGASVNTIKGWISLLEASYIIFLLSPYYKNYNKRMVKSPKMYFYDTGLASFLLNISDAGQFSMHHLRGGLFENFILLEFLKYRYNKGFQPDLYFWRDHKGKELDIILETPKGVFPYEIKSGKTFSYDFFSNLDYWNKISGEKSAKNTVIFGGSETVVLSDKMAVAWNDLNLVFESVS